MSKDSRPRFVTKLFSASCSILWFLFWGPTVADGQALTYLSGTVTQNGAPVSDATVDLTGNNLTFRRITDARGNFSFSGLGSGQYRIEATAGDRHAVLAIQLSASGASVSLALQAGPLQTIGRTVTVRSPVTRSSGTDVVVDSQALLELPNANSLPNILLQLPDAARGSNGQIHINGDHNGINYIVDGVELPSSLNRVLGNEIDPADIQSLDAIEGAYPAQYGDRFAAQLNIATKARTGPPDFDLESRTASFNLFDEILDAHAPIGSGGSLTFAGRLLQDGRALDPPVKNAPHNDGSTSNAFLRLSLPIHDRDSFNVDILHSTQTFEIPPDTTNGFPANQDDNEVQNDNFVSLQYRHALSPNASVALGPSYKNARLLDTADPVNDLVGAAGTKCTDFSNCQFFSVLADRVSQTSQFNVDVQAHNERHDVRAGTLVTRDSIPKFYGITVQPGSELTSDGSAFTASDDRSNRAFQQEAYIQDSWSLAPHWRLDYGGRYDAFEISSADFASAFRQISPRVKLTRDFGSRMSLYAYYGRLFVPFSFENVDPQTAAELYGKSNFPGATYDLRPQRDSLYETGFHVPLGSADVGFRLSHKVSTDWIDDTQIGSTNLHQDINFPQGRVDSESLYVQTPLPRNSRYYLSISHVLAVNSTNCETQLLQNCAAGGPPGGDFVQADHDQHYDISSGIVLNDRRGGWFSLTGEYGSGLSLGDTSTCPDSDAINCKVPPHITFDAAQAIALGSRSQLILGMTNLFDDEYAVTLDSSLQGTHYARPRTFFVRLDYNRR